MPTDLLDQPVVGGATLKSFMPLAVLLAGVVLLGKAFRKNPSGRRSRRRRRR